MLLFDLSTLDTTGEHRKTADLKIADLYEKFKRRLTSTALGITHNQAMAEDAVHNAFVAAIRHKKKILAMSEIDFLRWSVTVVRRKCIDLMRRDKHIADTSFDDLRDIMPSDALPVDVQVAQQDIHRRLMGYIAELDEVSRQILEMKYVLQMPLQEIADELGFTLSQVNNRIARARAKVKDRMGTSSTYGA